MLERTDVTSTVPVVGKRFALTVTHPGNSKTLNIALICFRFSGKTAVTREGGTNTHRSQDYYTLFL